MTAPAKQQQPPARPAAAPQQQPNGAPTISDKDFDAILDRPVEYTPFQATTKLTLSPRMVINYLCKPTRSGKLCSKEQAVRFVKLCEARGLNPWEGDAYLVGYDGKDGPEFNLITAHQAYLKRAEAHAAYDGMESGVTVAAKGNEGDDILDIEGEIVPPGSAIIGGWAKVHRKDRSVPTYARVRLEPYNTGQSRWGKDATGMIVKVAQAKALRQTFPNNLSGLTSPAGDAMEAEAADDAREETAAELRREQERLVRRLAVAEEKLAALGKPGIDPQIVEAPSDEKIAAQVPERERQPGEDDPE